MFSTSLSIRHSGFLTDDGVKIEAARTIWWLLHDSNFAVSDEKEVTIDQDQGELRQDRYPLRTAPQFLGPQIEDILAAMNSIQIECNSSTFTCDNCSTPLSDGASLAPCSN